MPIGEELLKVFKAHRLIGVVYKIVTLVKAREKHIDDRPNGERQADKQKRGGIQKRLQKRSHRDRDIRFFLLAFSCHGFPLQTSRSPLSRSNT